MLPPRVWRGAVESVAGNVITVEGVTLPTDLGRKEANGGAPGTVPAVAEFGQYVVIQRYDASATFPAGGNEGDWWVIDGSTGTTLTVLPGVQGPSVSLAAGDKIEVVPLASMRDMFGGPGGPAAILNKDLDGGPSTSQEDVINFFGGGSNGLGFPTTIFYADASLLGTEGYVINGEIDPVTSQPFTGEFITVTPDQAFVVFRKSGTATVKAYNAGHSHRTHLTHYCPGSASTSFRTAIGTGFPVNSTILATELALSAGIVVDTDGSPSLNQEDLLSLLGGPVNTSGLFEEVTIMATTVCAPDTYANFPAGVCDDTFSVLSGRGYLLGRKSGTAAALLWREAHPFKL
ncbi:MAG: hypothetical protein L0Z50_28160 [Verrucomicrobiales bacterium]|nr:hypothetical protein [Verrucomicrobiales bacterium]